ncbi:hypothetical protein [Kineococcus rhizosphaerae]|uniref:Uncharacterized protein n=1 Tax=Kineococcus rhizosphaerae TaxID=559628 RepID=A0A2T0QX79_9ACTN|nr:hypothetical protein [Kineococcus rhizosphaerae]PRY10489.1 hypothetical protein CLV37_11642 [Kineococcus rhizosphaerae]
MSDETFDLESVRRFVSRQARRARATRSSAVEDVPGLRRVRSQHLEDGWMHLIFDGWDFTAAAEIADLVLEPDAATFLALGPVSVFDGFAPVDEGGAGVPALVRSDPPPQLEESVDEPR